MKNECISFIIVSKNEEKRIQTCIESVIECSREYKNSEIILVDSASTDKTVDISKYYPIKIIQLKPNWPLSPAAGKYIGFLHSKGNYLIFIDGDMLLEAGWLKEALPYLKKDGIAGISGNIINVFEDGCLSLADRRMNITFKFLSFGEVNVLVGPAMFKRNILEAVGCYHPFLKAGEEAELSYRIIVKGYKLLRLKIPMVIHRMESLHLFTYIKKYHWNYLKSTGSSIRFSLRTNKQIFWRRFPAIIQAIFLSLYLFYVMLSLVILIKGYLLFAIISLAGYFFMFILLIVIRKNVEDALLSILIVHIRSIALLIGFLNDLPDSQQYPEVLARSKY